MESNLEPEMVRPADDVYAWIERNSSIHLKTATRFGDPFDWSVNGERAIAAALLELASRPGLSDR